MPAQRMASTSEAGAIRFLGPPAILADSRWAPFPNSIDQIPLMFRSLAKSRPDAAPVELSINGQTVSVEAGTTVWAAMALADQRITRQAPLTEKPRSAYCAMGVCFECMVEVNGMPNRQACLTEVQPGMQVVTQVITEQTTLEVNDD